MIGKTLFVDYRQNLGTRNTYDRKCFTNFKRTNAEFYLCSMLNLLNVVFMIKVLSAGADTTDVALAKPNIQRNKTNKKLNIP